MGGQARRPCCCSLADMDDDDSSIENRRTGERFHKVKNTRGQFPHPCATFTLNQFDYGSFTTGNIYGSGRLRDAVA